MADVSDALRVVVGLAEKATPGEWMLATSCSWRRILTTEHRPVIVPTTQRTDGHPDLDCGQDYVNAETAIAAVNFIREHGAALAQALENDARYRHVIERAVKESWCMCDHPTGWQCLRCEALAALAAQQKEAANGD